MSSLAAQLAGIKTNSNATILDKSKRKKIHSVSLIFDPKEAAQQDFETIYYTCIDKFRELELVDTRYTRFSMSLFSETAIRFDRQVQDAEHVDGLNTTIRQFLLLNASYLHLMPALYCLEWLVRRFQVHVLNAEDLLLSSLPLYGSPEFLRVLDVVPAQSIPPAFKFLHSCKQNMQNPSRNTLIRVLSSDVNILQLVNGHLEHAIAKGLEYNKLLVFWSSMMVWVLMAYKERSDASVLDVLLPVLSHLIVKTETPQVQIAAYMVLVVLCSQFPLDQQVTDASIRTITQTWSPVSRVQGLACISQLVRYSDVRTEPFSENEWTAISSIPDALQELINLAKTHSVGAFAVRYCTSLLQYAPSQIAKIKQVFDSVALSDAQLYTLMNAILGHLKDQPVDLIEWMLKTHADIFNKCLKENNLTIDKVEMALQTSLRGVETPVEAEAPAVDAGDAAPLASDPSEIEKTSADFKLCNAESFLNYETYSAEQSRFKLWLQATACPQISTDELVSLVHIAPSSEVSFLAAAAISPFPAVSRLKALEVLVKRIQESEEDFQMILPAIVSLLGDSAGRVRQAAIEVLKALESVGKGKVWGSSSIYGPGTQIKPLSRTDLKAVFKHFAQHAEECIMDSRHVRKIGGSAGRSGWIEFLVGHALAVGFPQVLGCLLVNLTGHKGVVKELLKLFEGWLANRSIWLERCTESRVEMCELEKALVGVISSNDKVGIQFLLAALGGPEELAVFAAERVVKIWSLLKEENQNLLINKLLDISVDTSLEFDPSATLHDLDLSAENFTEILNQFKTPQLEAADTKRRRRRSSNTQSASKPTDEIESHLRKVTLMLELLDHKSGALENPIKVFTVLFEILNELVAYTNTKIPVLYTQSLIADCINSLLEKIKSQKLSKETLSSIRVDVLVNCVRTSTNPQNQNKFLLLIASLAPFCPDLVFHSVMPIFTFMGANTVRLDNDYSAYVIQQTIAKVIPALVENGDKNAEIEIALRSFVAAFPHIPRHRRNKLFGALVKTLGPADSLFKLLLLLGQKYAEAQSRKKSVDAKALYHFATPFLRSFSVGDQLEAVLKYVEYTRTMTPEGGLIKGEMDIEETAGYLYTFLTLTFGNENSISGTQPLAVQINALGALSEQDVAICSNLIENLLQATTETSSPSTYDVLSKSLELLPIANFVTILATLANQEAPDIKIKVLQLVERKFEVSKDKDAAAEAVSALHLNLQKTDSVLKNEVIDAIDSIIFRFPSFAPETQLEILGTMCGSNGLLCGDVEIQISAINCINSLARNLGARIIGFFPKILPVLFAKCSASLTASDPQDIENGKTLQYATFALISGFIVRIPAFMNSCIGTVLDLVFSSNTDLEPREKLLQLVGDKIDSQTVVNAYVSSWDNALNSVESMELFFRNLDLIVANTPKKLVASRASQLFGMLLKCYTIRSMQRFTLNEVNHMETVMVASTVQIVLKLNDKVFRPQFLRMVRWAFEGEGTVMAAPLRHTVFMKFVVRLLGQLKSIVTNYYGYILDPVCAIVENPDASFNVSQTLIKLIYQSFILSFSSDSDDFWQSPTRFVKVKDLLLAQLAAPEIVHGNLLVKAIVALAEASTSQEHRKDINDGLGKLITATNPSVTKIWATRVLSALYSKLGEEWVTGLPQLVPLIAELLDDDDEEVESEVRSRLVPVIEEVLGESLDRYLS